MALTVAQRVKGILVSAGHADEGRAVDLYLFSCNERMAAREAYEDLGWTGAVDYHVSAGDYFTSKADGEAVVVRYHGSVHREGERLSLYRLAIENCFFQVAEEADPKRPGRKLLKVAGG